jgi:L-lactate dehydrogenase complex protein LldG
MEEQEMTAARDAILANIRKHRGAVAAPAAYDFPKSNDLSAHFIAKARAAIADVREIASLNDAPEAVRAILAGLNVARRIHIPAVSGLTQLPWDRASDVTVSRQAPAGDDTALSLAEYGIAETGTLAFLSGPRAPASWHYRPGREIVIVERATILPRLEDLFAKLRPNGLPATLNLVTGPSRTADIEQTIELGAHGPCALHILIAG